MPFPHIPAGGSVGRRIDGPAPLTFNMGRFLALANNSRADVVEFLRGLDTDSTKMNNKKLAKN